MIDTRLDKIKEIKLIKQRIMEETKNDKSKVYFCGVEVTQENFDFDDLLRMLSIQEEEYKRRIEDWKFCVELYATRP